MSNQAKEQLLLKLKDLAESYDTEEAHIKADMALIEYTNDAEIAAAYHAIDKWYA